MRGDAKRRVRVGGQLPQCVETTVNIAGAQRVAAFANGMAHAVWVQGTAGKPSVWQATFTPGAGWNAAERVDSSTSAVGPPNVAMDASGNHTVVWTQLTGTNFNVWARISSR